MRCHDLPLTRPPTVLAMSPGSLHGRCGEERYRSPFWCINLCFGASGALVVDGEPHAFRDGCAVVVPAHLDHRYRFAGPVTKVWAHFLPDARARAAPVPAVTPLGRRATATRAALAGAAARLVAEPERAQAALWELLWSLTVGPADGGRAIRNRLVDELLAHLDEHLEEPMRPATLAARFRVSEQHLGRLCRRATGFPVLAWLRRRRVARAVQLLQTTDLAIGAIAARVGIPDLQHFNKLVRRATGRAPSTLRARLDGRARRAYPTMDSTRRWDSG